MTRTSVLIVEDDFNWLRIFQTLVANATSELFDYVHVTDLKNALEAVKNNKFGLILLDLMLPDSHANNTIQVMTDEVKYTIPIVIITTLDDEKLIQNAFQHGVEDYLVKDQYNLETFIHVCRQAIRRFLGRWASPVQDDLAAIIKNLEQLDLSLDSMQQSMQ